MQEVWRPVVGAEKTFAVSNLGRVKSLDRRARSVWKNGVEGSRLIKGRILTLVSNRKGYQQVNIHGRTRLVHHLVLDAFSKEPRNERQCRHLDGNPANNCISNLQWGTPAEQQADIIAHGRRPKGERNRSARLADAEVEWIRSKKGQLSSRKIAALVGCSQQHVCKLWNNQRR